MTTWTAKVDGVDKVMADHVNKLQTYKLDRDLAPCAFPEEHGAVHDGVTNDSPAVQATILAMSDGDTLVFGNASYNLATEITVNRAIKIVLSGSQIIGPNSGWVFDITHNDASVCGAGDAKITLTAGCDGGILLNGVMRPKVCDISMDMNNVQNAIGLHQLGCWYADVRNVWIEKAKCHATSEGIRVGCEWIGGIPGPNGTYGGSYVSTYKNCTARVINVLGYLSGGDSSPVTTVTFTMVDTERILISHAFGISFFLPVVQGAGGTFIDMDTTSNCTFMGGDFEGTGTTVYSFTGSNRGVKSIGNQISGVGNVYMSGSPTASCYFDDDAETLGAGGLSGYFKGYLGTLQPLEFQNSATAAIARIGHHYVGNKLHITNNLLIDNIDIAYGTLTSDGTKPTDGDTVLIGTKTYTFKDALTPTEGEVLVGASAAEALDNLEAAVNHEGSPGGDYECAAPHPLVVAVTNTDTTETFQARKAGVAGNSIDTQEVSAHLSWGGAHLSGGAGEGALDDIAEAGIALTLTASGQAQFHYAEAGSGLVPIELALQVDNGGMILETTYVEPGNDDALIAGHDIGRVYKTDGGYLRIVRETTVYDSPKFATLNLTTLPDFANDAAAGVGGLVSGDLYTETGTDPLRLAVKT